MLGSTIRDVTPVATFTIAGIVGSRRLLGDRLFFTVFLTGDDTIVMMPSREDMGRAFD